MQNGRKNRSDQVCLPVEQIMHRWFMGRLLQVINRFAIQEFSSSHNFYTATLSGRFNRGIKQQSHLSRRTKVAAAA